MARQSVRYVPQCLVWTNKAESTTTLQSRKLLPEDFAFFSCMICTVSYWTNERGNYNPVVGWFGYVVVGSESRPYTLTSCFLVISSQTLIFLHKLWDFLLAPKEKAWLIDKLSCHLSSSLAGMLVYYAVHGSVTNLICTYIIHHLPIDQYSYGTPAGWSLNLVLCTVRTTPESGVVTQEWLVLCGDTCEPYIFWDKPLQPCIW